jgi:hypothetical protein
VIGKSAGRSAQGGSAGPLLAGLLSRQQGSRRLVPVLRPLVPAQVQAMFSLAAESWDAIR